MTLFNKFIHDIECHVNYLAIVKEEHITVTVDDNLQSPIGVVKVELYPSDSLTVYDITAYT